MHSQIEDTNCNNPQILANNFVKVQIYDYSVPSLIDTGAHFTVAPMAILDKIPSLQNHEVYPSDIPHLGRSQPN